MLHKKAVLILQGKTCARVFLNQSTNCRHATFFKKALTQIVGWIFQKHPEQLFVKLLSAAISIKTVSAG